MGKKRAGVQPDPPVEAPLEAIATPVAAAIAAAEKPPKIAGEQAVAEEAAIEKAVEDVVEAVAAAADEPPEAHGEAITEDVVVEKAVQEDEAAQVSPPKAAPASDDCVEKEMVVARPLAEVLDAVTDFPKYSLWVSGQKEVVDETPVGQTSPQVWKFKAGVPFGPSISYTLSYTIKGNQMNWVSVAGGVKKIVGEYRLTAIDDTHTQVNYKLEVDAGFGVPPALRKVVTGLVVGAALPELKRYLETKYAGIASSTSRPR